MLMTLINLYNLSIPLFPYEMDYHKLGGLKQKYILEQLLQLEI